MNPTHEILNDVVSYGKGAYVYAVKGEQVTKISESPPVIICEKSNGERFSTKITNTVELKKTKF